MPFIVKHCSCLSTYVDYITLKQSVDTLAKLDCLSTYVDYITLKLDFANSPVSPCLSTYVDYITLKQAFPELTSQIVLVPM